MSSGGRAAEEQPLLTSNGTAMGKGLSWENNKDDRERLTDVHVHVDGLHHNGLSRREKNGDAHHNHPLGGGSVKINLPPPEREESRFPPEKWKTFLALLFLAFNMTWTLTCLAIVHERMPDRNRTKPLPDVFFDVFPPVDVALDISEYIIVVSVWVTILTVIMHKHRFIIFRRLFVITGLLYFLRSITMFVTQLPVASTSYYCEPKANSTSPLLILERVATMMAGFGLSINGKHYFCGDYMYSGHTVILTMAYLVIREYSPRRFVLLHWSVWLSSCTGIFLVLLSRGHYTVDIVVAYFVTTRVFWIYHTMCNNAALKVPSTYNYLSRLWWFSIFTYFEKNVGGVVPRQYEWPLPWPKRFSKHTRIS